jgi:hypothetical protein
MGIKGALPSPVVEIVKASKVLLTLQLGFRFESVSEK